MHRTALQHEAVVHYAGEYAVRLLSPWQVLPRCSHTRCLRCGSVSMRTGVDCGTGGAEAAFQFPLALAAPAVEKGLRYTHQSLQFLFGSYFCTSTLYWP
jgi:hypothetical protein